MLGSLERSRALISLFGAFVTEIGSLGLELVIGMRIRRAGMK